MRILVGVSVPSTAASILPAYPVGAIRSVFTLPDRHVLFDSINQLTTCDKSLVTMGRRGHANDGTVAHRKFADAVECGQADAREFGFNLLGDLCHLLFSHALVGLVFK